MILRQVWCQSKAAIGTRVRQGLGEGVSEYMFLGRPSVFRHLCEVCSVWSGAALLHIHNTLQQDLRAKGLSPQLFRDILSWCSPRAPGDVQLP